MQRLLHRPFFPRPSMQPHRTPQNQLHYYDAAYDLLGSIVTETGGYSSVTYAYNAAARLTGVTNNGQVDSQNPATPASAMHYNAFGGLTTDTLGDAEVETFNYDKRLRTQSYTATINSPNYYSTPITLYSFSINSFAPNGDILSANDSVNGNWTYSYDPFNRLVGANQNNGAAVYSYVYDRFGNRWQQNGPTNTFVATFTGNNQRNPQNNNRIDGYTHDAADNIMSDGLHNYTYDAENRLIQVDGGNTATYVYDADGHRVQKTSATGNYSDPAGTWIFFYDQSGRWVQKFNSPGNTFVQGHIFAAGRHLASVGGWTTFSHSDWVGTERLRLGMGGIPYQTESCTSLPFGDGLNCTGSDVSNLHFTGKERDATTGLDNFGARYSASSMGRFMTPDWAAKPTTVPYAQFGDPQSLNLYAFVGNNPLRDTDADGHCYPWCTALVGAAAGFVIGGGTEIIAQKLQGKPINWKKVEGSAVKGTILGAAIGLAGPEAGALTTAAFGSAGNVAGGIAGRSAEGQSAKEALNPTEVLKDAANGAIGGAIGGSKVGEKLGESIAEGSARVAAASGDQAAANFYSNNASGIGTGVAKTMDAAQSTAESYLNQPNPNQQKQHEQKPKCSAGEGCAH